MKYVQESANDSNFQEKLQTAAVLLLPKTLSTAILKTELVAKLHFTDPPAYNEFVYTVYLNEDALGITDIVFDDNPCEWFDWDDIPFHAMPEDDRVWYPKVLQEGGKVTGSFTFGSWSEKTLKSYHIDTVPDL